MSSPKIAFLGAGRLASAIVRGLLARKVCTPADLRCTSKGGDSARRLAAETGITAETDLAALLAPADLVIVAFKPQSLAAADPRLAELTAGKLVLSLLAGKRLARLAQTFPRARNVIRTMPNTPAAIGAGMTPYCSLTPLATADQAAVETLLGALGKFQCLEEKHFDALTALVGSSPAFLFEFVAALRDGGVAAGLARADAQALALETVLGSAKLLAHTGAEPEALRDQVVSPNGTTFAGLQVLGTRGFRDTIRDTILAAARRAEELSRD
jgi:pyrroline-5-carboxylate reductase